MGSIQQLCAEPQGEGHLFEAARKPLYCSLFSQMTFPNVLRKSKVRRGYQQTTLVQRLFNNCINITFPVVVHKLWLLVSVLI